MAGKPVWIINRTKEMLESLKRPMARSATQFRQNRCSRVRQERNPLHQAGNPGGGRYLYPSGLFPSDKFKTGAERCLRRLAGRFPVPLSRLHLRHGRPCLQEQAGAGQPQIPPHKYLSDAKILIGEDGKA